MANRAAALAHDVWQFARQRDAEEAIRLYQAEDSGPDFRREIARRDLFYLMFHLLNRADMFHPWLYERVREVEVARDWHLDLWSREHRKSSIITFGCTTQDILASHGDDPLPQWKGVEPSFGIFSHSTSNAQKFLIQIKAELETNLGLQALFPDILYANPQKQARQWSNSGILVKRKGNKREATVEAFGLESLPTGAHFEVIIYDDVIDLNSVNTPQMIEKATEQWELSISLGVTEGGRQRYIGTRYGIMDPYAEIMRRDIVKVRTYPSTKDGTASGIPVLFSPEEHEKRRRSMGPTTFASQWLQKPIGKDTATFDIAHLQFAEVRPKTINIFILGDPANSKKRDSDRTGLAVLAMDAQRNIFLVDGYNHKMNLKERWDALSTLHKQWSNAPGVQGVRVGYERYGLQADIEHFETQMEIDGRHFDIEEVNWVREGSQSKDDRIGRLRPDFERGHFFLPSLVKVNGKLCFVKVIEGEVKYVEARQETKLMRQVARAGQLYRVLKPISRKDEQGQLYDLTARFIVEYLSHPALGSFKDLLDATSRVYDLDPKPPVIIDDNDLEPPVFPDS